MSLSRVRVFLISENSLLRDTLVRILRQQHASVAISANSSSPTLLEDVSSSQPDVVLFDSAKVALSRHRVISRMREAGQSAKVMFIGMEEDESTFLRAVAEGALGYVLENAPASETVRAIHAVASGQAVWPPQYSVLLFQCAARDLAFSFNPSHKDRFGLSRREQQLVRLLRLGFSNKEIGSSLNLSEQTVKNHIHRILRKVGASNRMEIVARCQSEPALAQARNLQKGDDSFEQTSRNAEQPVPNLS